MDKLDRYLETYAQSHRHPTNLIIHKICVPAIFWSTLGFLHTFVIFDRVHLSFVLALIALVFYASLKRIGIFIAMLFITAATIFSFYYVPQLRLVSIVVFVLAWIGQFVGHKIEGKKPSFFHDLLFLLIGPVWVLESLAGRKPRRR